jgi:hypothetical protein
LGVRPRLPGPVPSGSLWMRERPYHPPLTRTWDARSLSSVREPCVDREPALAHASRMRAGRRVQIQERVDRVSYSRMRESHARPYGHHHCCGTTGNVATGFCSDSIRTSHTVQSGPCWATLRAPSMVVDPTCSFWVACSITAPSQSGASIAGVRVVSALTRTPCRGHVTLTHYRFTSHHSRTASGNVLISAPGSRR